MDEHGFLENIPFSVVNGRKSSTDDHFMCSYPRIMLSQLPSVKESGMYIVFAPIVGLAGTFDWIFNECSCKGTLTMKTGALYCETCARFVFNFIPRYKFKLTVRDLSSTATFVMLDRHARFLIGQSCQELLDISAEGSDAFAYAKIMDSLVDRSFLFKISVQGNSNSQPSSHYSIRRLVEVKTNDMFKPFANDTSPDKGFYCPVFHAIDLDDIRTRAQKSNRPVMLSPSMFSSDFATASDTFENIRQNLRFHFDSVSNNNLPSTSATSNDESSTDPGKEGGIYQFV